jgi:hypothetical protein
MTVTELLELLERVKMSYPDAEVMTPTTAGTYIKANSIGTIKLMPVIPGHEPETGIKRRQAWSDHEWQKQIKDELNTERKVFFLVA